MLRTPCPVRGAGWLRRRAGGGGEREFCAYIPTAFSVHTWDLAQATGQRPNWDEEVLANGLDVIRGILPAVGRHEMFEAIRATMPEEMRSGPDPYDAAVPVAADAALIDQMVAHVGRRPR